MITSNQRTLNIITRACGLGFSFDETEALEDIRIAAEEFLVENDDEAEEEYCEVRSTGDQSVSYADGLGYEYVCSGEILPWSVLEKKEPGERVFHTTVLDSLGRVVKLFTIR